MGTHWRYSWAVLALLPFLVFSSDDSQVIGYIYNTVVSISQDTGAMSVDVSGIASDVNQIRSYLSGMSVTQDSMASTLSGFRSDVNNGFTILGSSLSSINANTGSIDTKLTTVNNNLTTINTSLGTINTSINNQGAGIVAAVNAVEAVNEDGFSDVVDAIHDLDTSITSGIQVSIPELPDLTVSVDGLSDAVISISNAFGSVGTDMEDSVSAFADAVTTLTNALANGLGVGVVNTNQPFALLDMWLHPDYYDSVAQDLFYLLYGHSPDSAEIQRIHEILDFYNNPRANAEYMSRIYLADFLYDVYDDEAEQEIGYIIDDMFTSTYAEIRALGHANYLEYGTYDLTHAFYDYTNSVLGVLSEINDNLEDQKGSVDGLSSSLAELMQVINGEPSESFNQIKTEIENPVEYNTTTEHSEVNNSVVNVVADLAGDWVGSLPEISTNIVHAETNKIENIENDGFQGVLNSLESPSFAGSAAESVNSALSDFSFVDDFVSALGGASGSCSFVIPLSSFNIGQGVHAPDVEIEVPNVRSFTDSYVHVFCGVAKAAVLIILFSRLWSYIAERDYPLLF